MLPNAVIFDEQDKTMQCKIPAQNQPTITSRPIPVHSSPKVAHHIIEESDDEGDQIPVLDKDDSYYEYYSDYSDDERVTVTISRVGPKPPDNFIPNPRCSGPRPPSNPVTAFRRGVRSEAPPQPPAPIPEPKPVLKAETTQQTERVVSIPPPPVSEPLPPMGKVNRRVSYHIEKKSKKLAFNGTETFTITLGSGIITKVSMRPDSKQISIQMDGFNGFMAVEAKDHTYYLRENSVTGHDICTVRYMKAPYDPTLRACYVYLHKPLYGDAPTVLRSKQPTVNKNGVKCLNFGRRAVIPSMKNCILVDDAGNEYAAVMRTSRTSMCVDVIPEIPAYCAIIIGVTAFVCRKV